MQDGTDASFDGGTGISDRDPDFGGKAVTFVLANGVESRSISQKALELRLNVI